MNAAQRRTFLKAWGPGLALLVLGYVLLTVFRDFRDDFAVEIWAGLGFRDDPGVLTASEIPIAIVTLLVFAGLVLIKDNRVAFLTVQARSLVGAVLMGASALGFIMGVLSPLQLMIGAGAGLYIGYMPFNAMLFERMIAATKTLANAGFLIYIADASGYLGTVGLLVYKNVFAKEVEWLQVYLVGAFVTSGVCLVFFLCAMGLLRQADPAPQHRVHERPAARLGPGARARARGLARRLRPGARHDPIAIAGAS